MNINFINWAKSLLISYLSTVILSEKQRYRTNIF